MKLFGGHFLGQATSFVYLTVSGQGAPDFIPSQWVQFSIYNFLVANFWPLYWIGFALDRVRCQEIYWHVFAVARDRAGDIFGLVQTAGI